MFLCQRLPQACQRLPQAIRAARSYHSVDYAQPHEAITGHYTELQAVVLEHALTAPTGVAATGFSEQALASALTALGLSPQMLLTFGSLGDYSVLVPSALMVYHMRRNRDRLVNVHARAMHELGLQGEYPRIKHLLTERLRDNLPVRQHLTKGLSTLFSSVDAVQVATEELQSLADDVAHYAGDAANDFAWYTKRAAIAKVYVALEMMMAQEPLFERVQEFVEEQVDLVATAGYAYNSVEEWVGVNAMWTVALARSQLSRG